MDVNWRAKGTFNLDAQFFPEGKRTRLLNRLSSQHFTLLARI